MARGEADVGFRAGGHISEAHQRAVRISGEFKANVITNGNGQVPMGILQNDPDATGQGATVRMSGVSRAELGGSVSAAGPLSIDNSGRLIAAAWESPIGTADLYVFAWALEDGAISEVIDVWITGAPVPGSLE